MDVEFFPSAPNAPNASHAAARHALHDLLSKGSDRIMIACAFCTEAGLAIMRPHLSRLRIPGSCLVVSADDPTDIDAVNDLAIHAPGAVWIHKTGKLPYEKKVGSALMHSKVFYAEAGDKCWLWVGSHNLTARATVGANLEAAIILTGHPSELPFQAARQHIEDCRSESWECPVEAPPIPDGDDVDVVVIHAEADKLPSDIGLWHARLGLQSAVYDWLIRPVAEVYLHLYKRGDLTHDWRYAVPWSSYHGTLTGLNFTEIHPDTPGIPASWSDEHYSIVEESSVLLLAPKRPSSAGIVTQAVINIESIAPTDAAFLPAKPKAGWDEATERRVLGSTDPDLGRFFTRASIQDGHLVYDLRQRGKANWKLSVGDLREPDRRQLQDEATVRDIDLVDVLEEKRARHPLIMRAKYRLRARR